MANIDDLVTVQKNGVVAINDLTASLNAFRALYESFVGNQTAIGITDATSANAIFVLPTTTGLTQVNMPFFDGLVINPGASVTVAVTYSES
jgi:hypothetical protein